MSGQMTRQTEGNPDAREVVLAARNVAKSYGNVHALKGVNFDIHRGQVTTLFGENGAGKSTLMKILSGVIQPTTGQIILDGRPVSFANANDARDRGISIIHQELSLAPNLSVRDNIFMGRELRGPMGVDFAEEERQVRILMEELEEEIDPLTPVEELRLGQQQIVEIARALALSPKILLLDEPAAGCNAVETEEIDHLIAEVAKSGVAILLVEHDMKMVMRISNHIVVLDHGEKIAEGDPAAVSRNPAVIAAYLGTDAGTEAAHADG